MTKIDDRNLVFYAVDPVSGIWQQLPPIPNVAKEVGFRRGLLSSLWFWYMFGSNCIGTIRVWLEGRDIVDQIPTCGSSIGVVDGCLYALGGFGRASVMKSVWRYNPILNSRSEATPMSVGRAYCKTGIINNKLYVVGGVTNGRGKLTPLPSAEVFDPRSGIWSELPSMSFSKTKTLPKVFLPDVLNPIVTGMASYRGKLYVPQSLCCWPFFVNDGGEVYDPESKSWVEMPVRMGEGWPTKQAATKLSVVVDKELYALDSCSSKNTARIKVYDRHDDAWKILEGEVPIQGRSYSETPHLLAGFRGKLHVITKGANNVISVWVNSSVSLVFLDRVWTVLATKNVGSTELVSCQIIDI